MKPPRTRSGGPRDYVIVFGAAVRPNGRPSAALRQRITSAAAWALEHPASIIMPTGAAGDNGPAEADVIKRALVKCGVRASRIVPEPNGRDTLESVRLCHQMIERRGDCARIVCCTSRYHQPRCALLLRLLGHKVILANASPARGRLSRLGLARLFLREFVALPYDMLLLLVPRLVRT